MNTPYINIKQFLAEQGIHPKQERSGYGMYLSPFRDEVSPSFKVDYNKDLWYDFGLGEGGTLASLIMRLENCTFHEAAAKLRSRDETSFSFQREETVQQASSSLQIVSIKPLENHHLINYLQSKRSIDIGIAREHCREAQFTTNGKSYFAVGFPCDAGGWELRNEFFKGGSSPKSATTIGKGSPTCLLFEGFMDMLSYLTLKKVARPTLNMAVLNSVHNLHRVEDFLRSHQSIHCFLDNDESGRRATAQVEKLGVETIDHSAFYRNHKDLNDYLIAHNQKAVQKPEPPSEQTPRVKPAPKFRLR